MAEYGLTEASTGISVGSQPPLVIPSTQPGDTSPYQPIVNSVNVSLMRTQSAPSNTSSPRSTKKRLSLINSETASSVDSSGSSGVHDLNLQSTDEDISAQSCISTPLEEKLSKSNVKRNKVRKISLERTPFVRTSSKENLSKTRRSSVEETPGSRHGKDIVVTPEEDKERNAIVKPLSLPGECLERGRSKSTEDTFSETPVRRRPVKDKDISNTVPRRRSLIERISLRSHLDNTFKRRNSLEMPHSRIEKGNDEAEEEKQTRKGQITEVNTNAKPCCLLVVVRVRSLFSILFVTPKCRDIYYSPD